MTRSNTNHAQPTAPRTPRGPGASWAQRIARETGLDAELVQGALLRAAGLALQEGIQLSTALAARLIGLPDDEPVASADGAVALAGRTLVEAQARLLAELQCRADKLREDARLRSRVQRELTDLEVPRRERRHASALLYRLAALAPGDDPADRLNRALTQVDAVVQQPLREMIRAAGWQSLERWIDEITWWWVA